MSKPIYFNEWLDIYGKWVHLRLHPPTESHVVTLIDACDGRPPWKGELYAPAEGIDIAIDARVVDLRYDAPDPEDNPIEPEFKGGHFVMTLHLPMPEEMMFDRLPGRTPPEPVERRPEPTPAPPLPPAQKTMLAVGEYPICSVCWAQGTKDRLLVSCSEGQCSEGLRVCVIRDIQVQLRALSVASKSRPAGLWVSGEIVKGLLAIVEHIPCMSEECDGPECHVPASKDCLGATRCHRCAAVRLARSVIDGQ